MQTIPLNQFIRVYDNALPAEMCRNLISMFESRTQSQILNGRQVRPGLEQSQWTEMDVGKVADLPTMRVFNDVILKYKAIYEQDCQMPEPLPKPKQYAELVLKRYRNSDSEGFQTHFDSLREVSNRYLVILWYLNNVDQGGETYFTDLDIGVAPKEGRLLIFPPYWMYRHRGMPPISGSKYILSTYLLW